MGVRIILITAGVMGVPVGAEKTVKKPVKEIVMNHEWKNKTDEEWKKLLTPEQYQILRKKGTEAAGSGKYDHQFDPGKYKCAGCGFELFKSEDKFDSGCGWPAFSAPSTDLLTHVDKTFGMVRTEVMCPRCGGHLGHVFEDGPKEKGGLRYCINSASLEFEKAPEVKAVPEKKLPPLPKKK